MKLGFVSAILPELTLEELFTFASEEGFCSIEVMCWPPGKAERRYAGVTHLDVSEFGPAEVARVLGLQERHKVAISGLGYYPNPLSTDPAESEVAVAQLHRLIDASADLGINVVNSFVGRNPSLSVDENWPRFLELWKPLIDHADRRGVKVGIENCPMLFSRDEWPGGKNLATSPTIWQRMFEAIPSPNFGLNYDPSHMILQHMDPVAPLLEFRDRLVHIHAKDVRIDRAALDRHGVFAFPKLWHSPKLPGFGDVPWGKLLGTLADTGYDGHVAIEVEDRAFEASIEKRKESLRISRRFLLQYLAG